MMYLLEKLEKLDMEASKVSGCSYNFPKQKSQEWLNSDFHKFY